MVKRLFIVVLLFNTIVNSVVSQSFEFSEPTRLEINSSAEELLPFLSPDGKSLYFTRAFSNNNIGGKFSGTDLWVSKRIPGGFGKPEHIFPFNKNRNDALVGMNAEGNTIFLLLTSPSKRIKGLYFSRINSKGWSKPEIIPIPGISSVGHFGAYVSPDFDVILLSMTTPEGQGQEDLFVSLKQPTGEWSTPVNLGPTINTSGFEISPFLSRDKKRIYFSSSGHKGFGDADIFYSDRLYDSWQTWSVPKNLGESINTRNFEAYPFVNDTSILFSSSQDVKNLDLYAAKVHMKTDMDIDPLKMKYLSDKELFALSPSAKITPFDFLPDQTSLTEVQKNKLVIVCKFLSNNETLKLHLIALRPTGRQGLEHSKQRLLEILEFVKGEGIEGSRVTLGSEIYETDNQSLTIKFEYYH